MAIDPLAGALQSSSLHTLLMLTARALTRAGFGDVEILDRRSSRQKSRFGGHELVCLGSVGTLPLKIAVKVVQDEVRTRMLDELAGTVIRTQSDLGILVTPHQISQTKQAMQANYRPLRLEVLDGAALAALLRRFGLACRGRDVDYAFLSELEEVSSQILDFLRKERYAN